MKKKENNKSILSILVIALVIVLGLWVIIIYPLVKFNSNENIMRKAGERFFQLNANRVPREGEMATVSGITLLDKSYIKEALKGAYSGEECDLKKSWVKVKKQSGELKYYVYLQCGFMSSRVDHKGPEIKLNGNVEMEVEKGSNFKDPGVKSVKDKTDGNIDISSVIIKSDIDTTKVGEYTIVYSATDSFENKTSVTRKVTVSQSLKQTILNGTNNDGIYKGLDVNNYIKFSGQLFRIVRLNDDGTVKIVSAEDISQVDYNSIDKWLNDYYYEHLAESSKDFVQERSVWCSDDVGKNSVDTKVDCKVEKNKKNAGLLSINEYNSSQKEGESYLYTNTINWTSNSLDDKNAWTTRKNFFNQESKYLEYSRKNHFNVRPSIVLKKNIKIIDGSGTADDPYDIGDFKTGKPGEDLNKRYSGEYVEYAGILYRIVETDGKNAKVIVAGDISEDKFEYGDGKVYNPNKKGNIGYNLENTVSSYIKTSYFEKHSVVVPIYENKSSYSGKKTEKKYNVKFSAPNLYDMYSSSVIPTWYINSSNKNNVRYLSSDNGTVYYDTNDYMSGTANLRFVAYFKEGITIKSGKGTMKEPYKVSD